MDGEVVLTLGIEDFVLLPLSIDEEALVANLPPHLCIEWSFGEDDLVVLLVLLLDLTIAKNLCRALNEVIAYEAYCPLGHNLPVTSIDGSGIACTLLLLLHGCIEACLIDTHPMLTEDQGCEVKREAIGIIEDEGIVPIEDR